MKRSAKATVMRGLRRAATWKPKQAGDRRLQIDELISPLRYDVLVRAQFFDFLAKRPRGESEDSLVQAAEAEPYAVWFREVAMARFRPWVLDDPAAFRSNFAERVLASRDLHRSFAARGYDTRRPVTLRVSQGVRQTDTGAAISRTVHVGDGGHRLAMLLQSGSDLLPGMYRLDPRPTPLIDNTSILLGPLGVSDEDYLAFVSPGYTRQVCPDLETLVSVVRAADPAGAAELESILAVHARARRAVG